MAEMTEQGRRRTVSVHAVGCKANFEELDCVVSRLTDQGFEVVPFGGPADWILVNTCTVTGAGDSDSRQAIRRAARGKGIGTLVVTGCLAQRDPLGVGAIPGVDWVVGNGEKARLAERILGDPGEGRTAGGVTVTHGPDPTVDSFPPHGRSRAGLRTRATLKIQEGCDQHCTFCVIPSVRGGSRSRPLEDTLLQARTLAGAGYREVMLTGINTALWGADLPGKPDLLLLLGALSEVEGVERFRLNSLEPQLVRDEWLSFLAARGPWARHLHLPLQSPDDQILKRMNRAYRRDAYARLLERALGWMPDAALGADVMVGFPGETRERFEDGLAFLRSLPLTYLHVFSYSERPGTAAPALQGGVSPEEKRERSAALRALGAAMRRRFASSQIGTVQEVLPEGLDAGGAWHGWSGNYIKVRWKAARAPEPRLTRVLLREVRGDGSVDGALVESTGEVS